MLLRRGMKRTEMRITRHGRRQCRYRQWQKTLGSQQGKRRALTKYLVSLGKDSANSSARNFIRAASIYFFFFFSIPSHSSVSSHLCLHQRVFIHVSIQTTKTLPTPNKFTSSSSSPPKSQQCRDFLRTSTEHALTHSRLLSATPPSPAPPRALSPLVLLDSLSPPPSAPAPPCNGACPCVVCVATSRAIVPETAPSQRPATTAASQATKPGSAPNRESATFVARSGTAWPSAPTRIQSHTAGSAESVTRPPPVP